MLFAERRTGERDPADDRRVLEEAGLIVVRRSGREKLHFLNPVPIRQIHDRWTDRFTGRHVTALVDLERALEEES